MAWSAAEDSFPIALGMHPIVHLCGIDSKKEVGVRVAGSKPINRLQVAARLGRRHAMLPVLFPVPSAAWALKPGRRPMPGMDLTAARRPGKKIERGGQESA